ncbi:MAG: TetR/AcrR family transcriptional regulator [Cardiobacteriaceae bacterium]|nr:TetR/AcrR family transcriptional regulator [Cardiobacteriaceae bacterium]
MRRTKEDVEETKNLIIETAIKLFDKKGYKYTKMSHIAVESNMTRGAVYWHFKNKQEILSALCQQYLKNDIDELKKLLNGHYSWQQTAEVFATFVAELPKFAIRLHFARIFFIRQEQLLNQELAEINSLFSQYRLIIRQELIRLIEQNIKNGEISNKYSVDLVHSYLQSVLTGVICSLTDPFTQETIKSQVRELIMLAFESFSTTSFK